MSDSRVECNKASGSEGSVSLVVTNGMQPGTETGASSYDVSVISTSTRMNIGKTGGMSLSLSGAGFGTRRYCCKGKHVLRPDLGPAAAVTRDPHWALHYILL